MRDETRHGHRIGSHARGHERQRQQRPHGMIDAADPEQPLGTLVPLAELPHPSEEPAWVADGAAHRRTLARGRAMVSSRTTVGARCTTIAG